MGNVQATHQKIENIIESTVTANATATANNTCTQDITVNLQYTNCPGGIQVEQNCTSYANASMEAIIQALATAELDNDTKQKVDGLAASMNISTTNQDTRQKILSTMTSTCTATTSNTVSKKDTYNLGVVECNGNTGGIDGEGGTVLKITQFSDANANCLVKQLVDAIADAESSNTTDQLLEGLKLPDLAACGSVLLLGLATLVVGGMLLSGTRRQARGVGAARRRPPNNNFNNLSLRI